MPSYLRMCVSGLVRDRGIPFSMKIDEAPVKYYAMIDINVLVFHAFDISEEHKVLSNQKLVLS